MLAISSEDGISTFEILPADFMIGAASFDSAKASILLPNDWIAFWISPNGPRASKADAALASLSAVCSFCNLSVNTEFKLDLNCSSTAAALKTS